MFAPYFNVLLYPIRSTHLKVSIHADIFQDNNIVFNLSDFYSYIILDTSVSSIMCSIFFGTSLFTSGIMWIIVLALNHR